MVFEYDCISRNKDNGLCELSSFKETSEKLKNGDVRVRIMMKGPSAIFLDEDFVDLHLAACGHFIFGQNCNRYCRERPVEEQEQLLNYTLEEQEQLLNYTLALEYALRNYGIG